MGKKSLKHSHSFTVKLNGDTWKIYVYTYKNFPEVWKDAIGVADYDHTKKRFGIHLRGPKISRDTIAHELFHAYVSYKDYSRLKPADIEEHFCELIGKKYKILYQLTEKIFNKIHENKDLQKLLRMYDISA